MKQLIAGPKALRHPKPYFACEIMPYLDSLAHDWTGCRKMLSQRKDPTSGA